MYLARLPKYLYLTKNAHLTDISKATYEQYINVRCYDSNLGEIHEVVDTKIAFILRDYNTGDVFKDLLAPVHEVLLEMYLDDNKPIENPKLSVVNSYNNLLCNIMQYAKENLGIQRLEYVKPLPLGVMYVDNTFYYTFQLCLQPVAIRDYISYISSAFIRDKVGSFPYVEPLKLEDIRLRLESNMEEVFFSKVTDITFEEE